MSKTSELYALRCSFSGDSRLKAHHRSGDVEDDGAVLWDYVVSTQSAEADLIDEEEHAEQRIAKRKFAKLLGLYFKKILSLVEFKFLAACMQSDKTPYTIGRRLGIDYRKTVAAINAKHKANMPKLLQLMRVCGYEYRRGIVLMPQWSRYIKRSWSYWWAHTTEEHKQAVRERTNKKRATNREEYNARQREYYRNNESSRQAKLEYSRERYQNLTSEQREAKRERDRLAQKRKRARNREAYNEWQRRYRAEHKEQFKEYERQKRARKKAQTQESARA